MVAVADITFAVGATRGRGIEISFDSRYQQGNFSAPQSTQTGPGAHPTSSTFLPGYTASHYRSPLSRSINYSCQVCLRLWLAELEFSRVLYNT